MHISDACFLVFLHLEQLRFDEMNTKKLLEHKKDLISNTFQAMMQDASLKALWNACFPLSVVTEKKGEDRKNLDDICKVLFYMNLASFVKGSDLVIRKSPELILFY